MKREFAPDLQAEIDKLPPQADLVMLLLVVSLGVSVFTLLEYAVFTIVSVKSDFIMMIANLFTLLLLVALLLVRNVKLVNDIKIKRDAVLNGQYNYSAVHSWRATAYSYQMIKTIVKYKLNNIFDDESLSLRFTKTGVHVLMNADGRTIEKLALVKNNFNEPENVKLSRYNDTVIAISFDISLNKIILNTPNDVIELHDIENADN